MATFYDPKTGKPIGGTVDNPGEFAQPYMPFVPGSTGPNVLRRPPNPYSASGGYPFNPAPMDQQIAAAKQMYPELYPEIASLTATQPNSYQPVSFQPSGDEVSNAIGVGNQVNQYNVDYYRGAQQSDPVYGATMRLLNPNDAQANYDVTMQGAELATARGIPGSYAGSETTGRLRQSDVERRAQIANSLLSGAHGRVPQPYDVSQQILSAVQRGQLSLQQAELELRRQVQLGQLDIERARLVLDAARNFNRGGGGGGGGGSPSYGYRAQPISGGGSSSASMPPNPFTPSGGGGGGLWYDDNGNAYPTNVRPERPGYGGFGGPDDPFYNTMIPTGVPGRNMFFIDQAAYPDVPEWTYANQATDTWNYAPPSYSNYGSEDLY